MTNEDEAGNKRQVTAGIQRSAVCCRQEAGS